MVFSKNGQVIDGSGQSIVILDTGIDLDHPFFGPDQNNDGISDRIAAQSDFASKPYNGNPENNDDDDASDTNGHGSHVASIAASSDPNYPGIAPGADIIVLKIFDSNNSGNFLDIEQALQWVLANYQEYNIASVNMSLSTGGNHVNPTNFGII
ncbi:Peptidase S8 and S53, subtilisin, kexin,sedolisin [Crocosphaera watsonii WH 0401]|nr:S8 family serine peptidase [Crocosphaera sp.]NQZ62021.1 S8 family serine peptidase [Crocosphaera sp.]CCQ61201.1 Peptidase S8 and S53, subtilisin, kexin,sedolisin [Crocosphaera watsonii WH 0401]